MDFVWDDYIPDYRCRVICYDFRRKEHPSPCDLRIKKRKGLESGLREAPSAKKPASVCPGTPMPSPAAQGSSSLSTTKVGQGSTNGRVRMSVGGFVKDGTTFFYPHLSDGQAIPCDGTNMLDTPEVAMAVSQTCRFDADRAWWKMLLPCSTLLRNGSATWLGLFKR